MKQQSTPTTGPYGRVLSSIERGEFQPVYILFGADSAAAEEIIAMLKSKLVAPGMEAFDFDNLHPPKQNEEGAGSWVADTLGRTMQPPAASMRRLIAVRDLDRLGKARARQFCEGLARVPDSCTVAATADYSPAMSKVFVDAGLSRFVVDLRQPGAADLAAMVRRWAREAGLDLSPDAVQLLLEVAGRDTSTLRNEVEKLATSAEPGTVVDGATVRRLAGRSRDFALAEYMAHLSARRVKEALLVLERLTEWGTPPMQVVSWLAGGLLGIAAGRGPEARNWPPKFLRLCLHQLYEINRAVVTGHPEPYMLLETFTICCGCDDRGGACALAGRPAAPEFCIRRDRRRAARRKVNA